MKSPMPNDEAIRERLLAELSKQRWAPLALINVVVRNGVVELWGALTDERERQAVGLRGFDVSTETAICEPSEMLLSALCKGGGSPVLQEGTARCIGAIGIVGLCMRR